MKDEESIFSSADIYLCSYLRAKGYQFTDVKTGRQVRFVFPNSEGLQDDIKKFYNNKDLVSANELFHCLKDLKAIVFNLPR